MSLKLILGCMYSGKTTEILRIVNSLKHINEKPIIIKPKIDDRYSSDKISTHNKQEYECQVLEDLSQFKNPFHQKYIIIEEAQFFKDLLNFVRKLFVALSGTFHTNKKIAFFNDTNYSAINFNDLCLLFNNNFSVCPLTTHIQIKDVNKEITKSNFVKAINNINTF